MRSLRRAFMLAALVMAPVAAAGGCAQILGLDEPKDRADGSTEDASSVDGKGPSSTDGNSGVDASIDATTKDAGDSGSTSNDAGDGAVIDGGADTGAPATYTTFSNPANWSTFDTTTIASNASNYGLSVFDGRYMHFFASGNMYYARFDTTMDFANTAAWEIVNLANISGELFGMNSAGFDGRYIYLSPTHYSSGRYDTLGDPADAGAWTASGQFQFSAGMVYDGRYIYEVPNYQGVFLSTVERYDTISDAGFANTASWQSYDTSNQAANAKGYLGGAYDGRYAYMVPGNLTIGTRYDTTINFTSVSAWSAYDFSTAVDTTSTTYFGAVFDGRYLYYVPNGNNGHTFVNRYDTTADFQTATSYTLFDVQSLGDANAVGYRGGIFDGRYLYMMPDGMFGTGDRAVRYDTTAPYSSATSWEIYTTTGVNAASKTFCSGGFDGEYVYYLPCGSGLITRFLAKTPASVPNLPPHLAHGISSFL